MRWTLVLLALVGCNGCDGGAGTDTGPDGTVPADALKFLQENNYSYTGEIDIDSLEVQAGADSTIDWCGLTVDLRGRAVDDPSAVDQLLLAEFTLTQQEVMEKVETNTLLQNDSATLWTLLEPGSCSVQMSQFDAVGNFLDPETYMVERSDRTWLVSVMNTPDDRIDILMSKFIVPTESATTTLVEVGNECATLIFDADLQSAPPLQVADGEIPWLDWSGVTHDVNGAPFDPMKGDRLIIGKVPVETIEEAEAIFLRLDEEAEALYYLDVYAVTNADLGLARTDAGEAFGGFTTDGIWFVGVECLSCTSPAPLILAVVEVGG